MKAKDLAEFLLQYPDAQVNIPSLSEGVYSTPLRESDLKVRNHSGGTIISINNERTFSEDSPVEG